MKELIMLENQNNEDDTYVSYKLGDKQIDIIPVLTDEMFDSLYYGARSLFESFDVFRKYNELSEEEKTKEVEAGYSILSKFFDPSLTKPDFRSLEKFVNFMVATNCIKDFENLELTVLEYTIIENALPDVIIGYDKLLNYIDSDFGANNISYYKVDKFIEEHLNPIFVVLETILTNEDARNQVMEMLLNNAEKNDSEEEPKKKSRKKKNE